MNKIVFGDCRETMRRWAADGVKVQMCVTSPPYFGLRDYGHEGQIGLEETPEQYIAAMVEVFRCVKDVLADDGTLWLNIGDSYAGGGGYAPNAPCNQRRAAGESWGAMNKFQVEQGEARAKARPGFVPDGCKPKDLIGIPWMLAFALRADGWYLRQDIIWHKPNPMPESVRDRCTKAHEYIFLLSKSGRYFFDSEAMKEPASDNSVTVARNNRADKGFVGASDLYGTKFGQSGSGSYDRKNRSKRDSFKRDDSKREQAIPGQGYGTHRADRDESTYDTATRNRRSVWTVATKPYKGAHFATFPTALVEPCILAGSRPGDIVLDPFMGSGTTAQVAMQHDRKYLGCELNPEYGALQQKRISSEMTLFNCQ